MSDLFIFVVFFTMCKIQGSILGAICSLVLTLFIGIGSIIQGNAGKLSNQKLPLRTDGCYILENETQSSTVNYFIVEDSDQFSVRGNTAWKDEEFSALNSLFGISYLWLPAITVCSAIIFGLIFSMLINIKSKQAPVKEKYLTPIIVTMWKKILDPERLKRWIEFESIDDNNKKFAQICTVTNGNGYNIKEDSIVPERKVCFYYSR